MFCAHVLDRVGGKVGHLIENSRLVESHRVEQTIYSNFPELRERLRGLAAPLGGWER
jgi:hypothetical protein